jgi:pimeloyl-ACP methyl ester carboxylesterase
MPVTAVFVHGMWSQCTVWDDWVRRFRERGYDTVCVSLPGHTPGVPDAELARVGFAECVASVESVVAALERPVLIGHSMGGLIVQQLASRHTLRAAVLINSAAPRAIFPQRLSMLPGLARHYVRWGLWRDVMRLSPREADYLLLNALPVAERARHYEAMVGESGRLAYQLGFGPLGWSRLHHVDPSAIVCPMLALAGKRDRMTPVAVSRRMAAYYGERLSYQEHPGAHWLLAESGYRDRIDDVLAWLATHHASSQDLADTRFAVRGRRW